MNTITVPVAVAILSKLSTNPSTLIFNNNALPSREETPIPGEKRIAKLLDALASLLPEKVGVGQVYAISLLTGSEQLRICVCANKKDDLTPQISTALRVTTIWDILQRLVTAIVNNGGGGRDEESNMVREELVHFVFRRHWSKMQARFHKRSSLCEKFLSRLPAAADLDDPKKKSLVTVLQELFAMSTNVFSADVQMAEVLYNDYHMMCGKAIPIISAVKRDPLTTAWLAGLQAELQIVLEAEYAERSDTGATRSPDESKLTFSSKSILIAVQKHDSMFFGTSRNLSARRCTWW
jgi:hypothetical protein